MAQFKGANYSIHTPSHHGVVNFIENDLLQYERTDHHDRYRVIADTYGPSWLLGWTDFDPQCLTLLSGATELTIKGPHFVFIPSFSLVYWKVRPGAIHWRAAVSSVPLPGIQWERPLLFPFANFQEFTSIQEVANFLHDAYEKNHQAKFLDSQLTYSRISRLVKEKIDKSFRDEISIAQIAQDFGQSHIVLTRNFTKAYGIPPLKYRQRVRLFEALNLMNQGMSVTEAVFASGFTNLSEFNRQFKSVLDTNPRNFSPRHNNKVKNPEV